MSWRACVLVAKTLMFGEGIRGTVVSLLFLLGLAGVAVYVATWLESYMGFRTAAWILLALFIYGLFRASYEIEAEKRTLEKQIATEEQRAALKEVLAEAMREGENY